MIAYLRFCDLAGKCAVPQALCINCGSYPLKGGVSTVVSLSATNDTDKRKAYEDENGVKMRSQHPHLTNGEAGCSINGGKPQQTATTQCTNADRRLL